MANFNTHLQVGAIVSGVIATSLMAADLATPSQMGLYAVLGTIGSLLPDIDSDNSTPIKLFINAVSIWLGFVALALWAQDYSLIEIIILWTAVYLGIRYGIFTIFTYITVHRGIIHSVPAAVFFWFCTTILLDNLSDASILVSWTGGFMVFLGFLTHLILDEVYSVDLYNMTYKKSFGTALKFYSFRNTKMTMATLALYATVVGLYFLMPDPDRFYHIITDVNTYKDIVVSIFPQGTWFVK